ncbi:hypothetical protein [Archangium gephyra]|uniref:hypothetical protein n=1 Tax=Archangium gephyra TaxID=48 RepID=UPI0012E14B37|nr:hypothetical protein [Archangium gephyra]
MAEVHVRHDDAFVARLKVARALGELAQVGGRALVHVERGAASIRAVAVEHRPSVTPGLLPGLPGELGQRVVRSEAGDGEEAALPELLGDKGPGALRLPEQEVQADQHPHGSGEPLGQGHGAPSLAGLHRVPLRHGGVQLGLEGEEPALMEDGADGLAHGGKSRRHEALVDALAAGGTLDSMRAGDHHHVPGRVSDATEDLPGNAVLGEDDEADLPGPARI